MPLETERNLRLALPAETYHLFKVLIRRRVHTIARWWQDHLVPLPQNAARLNLIHQAAFTFKTVTNWTSHIGLLYSLLFHAVVTRLRGPSANASVRTMPAGLPRMFGRRQHIHSTVSGYQSARGFGRTWK